MLCAATACSAGQPMYCAALTWFCWFEAVLFQSMMAENDVQCRPTAQEG
jgi:hypothetical protein